MRKMSRLNLSYISFCSPDHHVMITLISQNARLCVTIVIKTIFWFRHLTLNSSLVVIDIISMQYKTKPTPFQKWKKSSFNHVNCKSERTSMAWKSGNELIFFVFWIMVSNGRFEKKKKTLSILIVQPQEIFSYFTLVSTSFLKGNRWHVHLLLQFYLFDTFCLRATSSKHFGAQYSFYPTRCCFFLAKKLYCSV